MSDARFTMPPAQPAVVICERAVPLHSAYELTAESLCKRAAEVSAASVPTVTMSPGHRLLVKRMLVTLARRYRDLLKKNPYIGPFRDDVKTALNSIHSAFEGIYIYVRPVDTSMTEARLLVMMRQSAQVAVNSHTKF